MLQRSVHAQKKVRSEPTMEEVVTTRLEHLMG
jgi:hypothetical protein